MNIYELTQIFQQAQAAIETAETPEQLDEMLDALDEAESDYTAKAEGYARMMINYQTEAAMLKAEKQRLEAKQRAAERVADRLKARMLESMQELKLAEVHTTIGKWRIQKNPPRVEVLDAKAIPEQYRIPQPDAIDKAAIMKWYKETGEILPGVDVVQGSGVRFK